MNCSAEPETRARTGGKKTSEGQLKGRCRAHINSCKLLSGSVHSSVFRLLAHTISCPSVPFELDLGGAPPGLLSGPRFISALVNWPKRRHNVAVAFWVTPPHPTLPRPSGATILLGQALA